MKKTLVALAAVAATSAFAQSSVSIYGLFDIAYGTQQVTMNPDWATFNRKTTGLLEGTLAGNRIGFRGTEDLGGGMKAGFVLETGFTINGGNFFAQRVANSGFQDTTAGAPGYYANQFGAAGGGTGISAASGRQAFASVSGAFGEVRAGYQYMNLYTLSSLSGYQAGTEGSAGADVAHMHGNTAVGGIRGNLLTYISPTFNGFSVTAQYGSPGAAQRTVEGAANPAGGSDTEAKVTSLKLDYANGPLKASLAHTSATLKTNATSTVAGSRILVWDTAWWGPGNAVYNVNNTAARTGKLTNLGVSYNFGVASVAGTYNNGRQSGTTYSAADTNKFKSWQLGATVPFGAASAFVTTGKSTIDSVEGGYPFTTTVKQVQLGAKYALSKRTTLFAITGEDKLEYSDSGYSGQISKGKSTRLGVQHAF